MKVTLVQRLRCFLAGHPTTISVVEEIDGRLWNTLDTCACGHRTLAAWPGSVIKAHHEAYRDYPTEWVDLY